MFKRISLILGIMIVMMFTLASASSYFENGLVFIGSNVESEIKYMDNITYNFNVFTQNGIMIDPNNLSCYYHLAKQNPYENIEYSSNISSDNSSHTLNLVVFIDESFSEWGDFVQYRAVENPVGANIYAGFITFEDCLDFCSANSSAKFCNYLQYSFPTASTCISFVDADVISSPENNRYNAEFEETSNIVALEYGEYTLGIRCNTSLTYDNETTLYGGYTEFDLIYEEEVEEVEGLAGLWKPVENWTFPIVYLILTFIIIALGLYYESSIVGIFGSIMLVFAYFLIGSTSPLLFAPLLILGVLFGFRFATI